MKLRTKCTRCLLRYIFSFLHPILTVKFLLTGTQQDNELDKRNEKGDASPAKQNVHHTGKRAAQVESVYAHKSEEEAQQHGGNFALRVNLLLRAAVRAVGR